MKHFGGQSLLRQQLATGISPYHNNWQDNCNCAYVCWNWLYWNAYQFNHDIFSQKEDDDAIKEILKKLDKIEKENIELRNEVRKINRK